MNSVYKKLEKVRKPRVQISYELEDGGKSVKKELPFVVGVMGDYAGHSEEAKTPFKDRKFVQINGENFNQVMQKMQPKLQLKVENKLNDKQEDMPVELTFNTLEDFEPDRIAEQVPALKKLLEIRAQLRDLMSKADRSDNLGNLLERILQDDAQLKQLAAELEPATESPANPE